MGNNITSKLKYKESVVKFSYKYGATKAAIKFGECRRFEKTLEELGIEYKVIKPLRPLGWLSPNEFIKQYKSQGESILTV